MIIAFKHTAFVVKNLLKPSIYEFTPPLGVGLSRALTNISCWANNFCVSYLLVLTLVLGS